MNVSRKANFPLGTLSGIESLGCRVQLIGSAAGGALSVGLSFLRRKFQNGELPNPGYRSSVIRATIPPSLPEGAILGFQSSGLAEGRWPHRRVPPVPSFWGPGRPQTPCERIASVCLDGKSLQIITYRCRTMISEVFLQSSSRHVLFAGCPRSLAFGDLGDHTDAAKRGRNVM
jgi:hypothetical protein